MGIFKKIFIIILFLFILCPFYPSAAGSPISTELTGEIEDQMFIGVNYRGTFEETGLTEIIASVIKTFLSLLGIIFIVLMIYGGYTWMTAQGDESKVEKAKSTIQTAVIGLIIVVSTYSITHTIFQAL